MKEECYLFFETLATKLKVGIISTLKDKPSSVNELPNHICKEDNILYPMDLQVIPKKK